MARAPLSKSTRRDLIALRDLTEAGRVAPVRDEMYQLTEAAAALGHLGCATPQDRHLRVLAAAGRRAGVCAVRSDIATARKHDANILHACAARSPATPGYLQPAPEQVPARTIRQESVVNLEHRSRTSPAAGTSAPTPANSFGPSATTPDQDVDEDAGVNRPGSPLPRSGDASDAPGWVVSLRGRRLRLRRWRVLGGDAGSDARGDPAHDPFRGPSADAE